MRHLATLAIGGALFHPSVPLTSPVPSHVFPIYAAPKKAVPKPPPPKPPPPLAMLPSVPRVRVEVFAKEVLVVEEVNLPRGEYDHGPLDFYVAFGAPGPPLAIDAHLVPVLDGALEADDDTIGERLVTTHAPRRPNDAHPLLGRDAMAGVVVHVPQASFVRALSPGKMAAIRLRSVVELPDVDADGARGLVIRLGASRGTPLTLGRIGVTGRSGVVTRAQARLCGPEASADPLAVRVTPKPENVPSPPDDSSAAPIAPVLAVRHTTDDLCLRFWTKGSP